MAGTSGQVVSGRNLQLVDRRFALRPLVVVRWTKRHVGRDADRWCRYRGDWSISDAHQSVPSTSARRRYRRTAVTKPWQTPCYRLPKLTQSENASKPFFMAQQQWLRETLREVADGKLSPDDALLELQQFEGVETVASGGGSPRRLVLTGRFLNIDIFADDKIEDAVAEPHPEWTARRENDVLFVDGPPFAHGPTERAVNDRGEQVSARSLEDRGDCVLRMRVPVGIKLEGDVLAGRIVTHGIRGFKGWLVAEYASIR